MWLPETQNWGETVLSLQVTTWLAALAALGIARLRTTTIFVLTLKVTRSDGGETHTIRFF